MKTLDELRQYFHQTLIPEIQPLEEERKKVVKNLYVYQSVFWALYGGVVAIFWKSLSPIIRGDTDSLIGIVILAVLVSGGIYWVLTKTYKSNFKDQVIEKIVQFADSNLSYSKTEMIPPSLYELSQIFPRRVDRYKGDDLVSGRVEKTDILFSELHTQYRVRTNKRTSYRTIFKGLFFMGDFHKDFKGKTLVLPDTAEKSFGQLGSMLQSWNTSRGELVKMEDPEFEKAFVVYGSDQIEARYILSTSLMARIMDFRKRHYRNIYLAFVNSKVFVAISYNKNLFEPKVFTTLLSFEPIQEYFSDLSLALGIVEDLNLNTRIWSKA